MLHKYIFSFLDVYLVGYFIRVKPYNETVCGRFFAFQSTIPWGYYSSSEFYFSLRYHAESANGNQI